jgi:hypothetical protein
MTERNVECRLRKILQRRCALMTANVYILKFDVPVRLRLLFALGFMVKLDNFLELKLHGICLCSPFMPMSGAAGVMALHYPAGDVRIRPQLGSKLYK